jgi:hypothetical protein
MSSDNLQMHPINSSVESTLANSQNSNSSTSMQKSANIQFVSDSPITDPGQSNKVRSDLQCGLCVCECDRFMTHFIAFHNYLYPSPLIFFSGCLQAM